MPDEELIIDIEADAEALPNLQEAKEVLKPEPQKIETPVIEPVEDLRNQLETLRQREAAAIAEAGRRTQEAQQARQERDAARTEKFSSDASAIESAITAEKQAIQSAKDKKVAALESGNYKDVADADELMAVAAARLARFEDAKSEIDIRIKEPVKEPERKAVDPFEQSIAQATPRAQSWLRAHPEYVKDEKLNRKANIAHLEAVDAGHTIDSDAYYDFCERKLGLKADPEVEKPKPAATVRTKPMPSAPVSRDGAPINGGLTSTQVALTPGEQRAATDGTITWTYDDPKVGAKKGEPVGLKEYGRRKLLMQKQGLYDRSYTDQ